MNRLYNKPPITIPEKMKSQTDIIIFREGEYRITNKQKTIKNKNFPWFCYEFIDKKNSFFYHFMMTSQAAIVLFKLENTDMEEELKSKLRWKILMDSTTIIPSNYSIFS